MAETPQPYRGLTYFLVCLVVIGLFAVGSTGTAAADTPSEPDLQCIGSGVGIPYTTGTELTVYENHTAGIDQFYFPADDTVRFNYSTGVVDVSGEFASARLESVTDSAVCLGDINATDGLLTVQPDDGVGITLLGSGVELAFREPVFDASDDDVDLVYDAGSLANLKLGNTGLDEGQTVRAYDDDGIELENTTVDNRVITFDSLPDDQPYRLTFVAEVDGDDDDDSSSGGGSSGGSSSSDAGETERKVTEVDAEGTDDGGEASEESDVRSSSASASVSAGSTLSISLGLDDLDIDGPDEQDDPDVVDDDPEEIEEEPDEIEDEADDVDEETDEPPVADSDIGERPPPVSQADVERVEIDVNQDVDADIEIRQSRSPPSEDAREFERDDGTQEAGYVQVRNNLDADQVDGGRITYRMSKEDLATDDTNPENVAMYYFNTDTEEWDELPTEVVGETDTHVRFRAETPGFSQFASGIKRAQFEVSDAVVDVQEVTLGDTVRVEAIITNTGGADGTFRTELVVDDEVVEDEILTIASGGTRATIFDHEFLQADTYEVRVNDVSTGEITVLAPASAEADAETDDFIPGFGFVAGVVALLVAALGVRRRQR